VLALRKALRGDIHVFHDLGIDPNHDDYLAIALVAHVVG